MGDSFCLASTAALHGLYGYLTDNPCTGCTWNIAHADVIIKTGVHFETIARIKVRGFRPWIPLSDQHRALGHGREIIAEGIHYGREC